VFPELNHNEMQGFGTTVATELLHPIFLQDRDDHSRVQKRMQITEKLYEEKGYTVTSLSLKGEDVLHKVFSSLLLADLVAIALAEQKQVDPESVPLIEAFKTQLQESTSKE
jgi:glucose/mannose-6-phosphate isomerase